MEQLKQRYEKYIQDALVIRQKAERLAREAAEEMKWEEACWEEDAGEENLLAEEEEQL